MSYPSIPASVPPATPASPEQIDRLRRLLYERDRDAVLDHQLALAALLVMPGLGLESQLRADTARRLLEALEVAPKALDPFQLCSRCAAGVANGDDSVWEELDPPARASVDAAIEIMRWGHIERVHHCGYVTCFVCDEVTLGEGATFWSERRPLE